MHGDEIGTAIVDGAVDLHHSSWPKLSETVHEVTLARGLGERELSAEHQVPTAGEYLSPTLQRARMVRDCSNKIEFHHGLQGCHG